nr:DUF3102 domain-containing protein [uncultured Blautia sp.]
MTELANTQKKEIAVLDNLAMQAKTYIQNARMNLLQLGRVLAEAKPLVPHGEWENWVKTNTSMSKRAAEQYMQAYAEFGLNPQIAELGTTKTLKLLPLTEDEREKLLSENDVSSMSTRQLDEAIRKQKQEALKEARQEVQGELEKERTARIAAEQRAKAAESRPPEVTKELSDKLRSHKEQMERLTRENSILKQEIRERDEELEEQQADYNRAQEELLNIKSQVAKGDAERVPTDQLTVDAFASAVRAFIGACARMPHMSATFSAMSQIDKNEYDELLRTVEAWAKDSRKALDSVLVDSEVL